MDLMQELQRLKSAWLHREQQVEQLLALLHQRHTPDILVHGPPCTGKTSVVRSGLYLCDPFLSSAPTRRMIECIWHNYKRALHQPVTATSCKHLHIPSHTHRAVAACRAHAYLRCTRSSKLRQILSSILSQLQAGASGKRKRAQGYAPPSGSEATLIADLQALCSFPSSSSSVHAAAAGPAAPCGSQHAPLVYGSHPVDQHGCTQQAQQRPQQQQRLVVLDDVHHLLMADDAAARPGDGAPVLRGLLQVGMSVCMNFNTPLQARAVHGGK